MHIMGSLLSLAEIFGNVTTTTSSFDATPFVHLITITITAMPHFKSRLFLPSLEIFVQGWRNM